MHRCVPAKCTAQQERRRPRTSSSPDGVSVILVYSTRDARPTVARHPHDPPIHAAVEVATAAMLGREGVEVGQQGHRREPTATGRCPRRSGSRDPPPPAVLLDGPSLLLHLEPPPRPPALVRAGLLPGDVPLVPALDHLLPCLQAVRRGRIFVPSLSIHPPAGTPVFASDRMSPAPAAASCKWMISEPPRCGTPFACR